MLRDAALLNWKRHSVDPVLPERTHLGDGRDGTAGGLDLFMPVAVLFPSKDGFA
jgi:hypothetical protein